MRCKLLISGMLWVVNFWSRACNEMWTSDLGHVMRCKLLISGMLWDVNVNLYLQAPRWEPGSWVTLYPPTLWHTLLQVWYAFDLPFISWNLTQHCLVHIYRWFSPYIGIYLYTYVYMVYSCSHILIKQIRFRL